MERVIGMNSVRETVECEWIVEKSRFLGFLAPAGTMAEVEAFVAARRAEHPGARHVCFACLLSTAETAQRASDDGEPRMTAGVPMLEVLRKSGLTDVVAVVVRYFGGIKLGAGGLIRAYGNAVRGCVGKAALSSPVSFSECRIRVGLAEAALLEGILRQTAEPGIPTYGEDAVFPFVCETEKLPGILEEIRKRTASAAKAETVRTFLRFL